MAKYKVLSLLSKRQGGFIQPGEVVELTDEQAKILLEMKAVEPHRVKYRRKVQAESELENNVMED